ncbi:MAG: hypothetical protein A2107_02155 [Verrucomicrobia bacterium GWF2_62_7]|nr:MAG: hypothetical protein A2107_02155 [Verrucomicrobia bacterium GWF2_62_7]
MTETELAAVIEKAFDYRGDVTVDLKDGRQMAGYLSNRNFQGAEHCPDPFIELMVASQPELVCIACRDIANIRLTGEDTAAGKSWEDWVAKEATKKKTQGKA